MMMMMMMMMMMIEMTMTMMMMMIEMMMTMMMTMMMAHPSLIPTSCEVIVVVATAPLWLHSDDLLAQIKLPV
jgi:hypothetical protein